MKIVLVIPTLRAGGAERVMSELANIWATESKIKHEVHLVLTNSADLFYTISPNIKVHELGFRTSSNLLKKVYSQLTVFFKLRKLIHDLRPSFVLSFLYKINIFVLLATLGLRSRIIVSERNSPTEQISSWIVALRKITYPFAHGVITQTLLGKEFIESEIRNDNVIRIPNPIKTIERRAVRNKEKIILCIGRLFKQKGHAYLIDAFSRIKLKGWKVVILGDGPLRKSLEAQAKKLGISKQVKLPGTVSDIDTWLAKSAIFAFPSLREGFPNALAEAMAAGLPCVSFDCDTGPRDLIVDGVNGYLVEVGDLISFSDRICRLATNVDLQRRIGKEASGTAVKLERHKIASTYFDFCSGRSNNGS